MINNLAEITPALKSSLADHARHMRRHIIDMTSAAGSGHPGPSFSPVEILSALYFSEMRISPNDPDGGTGPLCAF